MIAFAQHGEDTRGLTCVLWRQMAKGAKQVRIRAQASQTNTRPPDPMGRLRTDAHAGNTPNVEVTRNWRAARSAPSCGLVASNAAWKPRVHVIKCSLEAYNNNNLFRPLVIGNSGNPISVHVPRTHVARAVEEPVVVVVVVAWPKM